MSTTDKLINKQNSLSSILMIATMDNDNDNETSHDNNVETATDLKATSVQSKLQNNQITAKTLECIQATIEEIIGI